MTMDWITLLDRAIATVPTIITIVIAAWLQRRSANDKAEEAALIRASDAAEAKASREHIASQLESHTATVNQIAKDVDGNLSAIVEVTRKYADEIMRLQSADMSTPTGKPSLASPVTLSVGGAPMTSPDKRRTDDAASHTPERSE